VQAQGSNGPSLWSTTWSFTTGNPPSIPSLQSPANGALQTVYQPTLDWTDSTLPVGTTLDHYQVRLATDNSFTNLVYDENTAISQFPLPAPLAPNARYYWQVRALNTAGHFSTWSVTRYFTAAIQFPALIDPANAAALLTRRPTFDWGDVTGASSYVIHISRSANFSTILKSATVTPSRYAVTSDLPADTVLYWRVQAKGANGPSLWSSVWSLKTGNPPSAPSLQSPANNTLLTGYQPTLNWSDSTLPAGTMLDHYQVQLATNSSFGALLYDTSTSVSAFRLPAPLPPNAKYYWRVRAFNPDGHYSNWSSARNFRTPLAPPVLSTPASGAVLTTRRPQFDWGNVSGASSYTIQVSRYSTFSSTLLSVRVNGSAYTPSTRLPTGVTLYWRVRANGTNGPSRWAEVPARTFKIVLP
jgi:predicted phage tail protein